jgi:hypothetical protein
MWRRVVVPAEMTLAGLHDGCQAAFGWWDYHLHKFQICALLDRQGARAPATWPSLGTKTARPAHALAEPGRSWVFCTANRAVHARDRCERIASTMTLVRTSTARAIHAAPEFRSIRPSVEPTRGFAASRTRLRDRGPQLADDGRGRRPPPAVRCATAGRRTDPQACPRDELDRRR